jgi:predicted nucleic acid-binding protein
MARCVISDASPLIGLAIVDGLVWLPQLFGEVWIPPSVQREVLPGVGARGEMEIAAAIKLKSIRIWKKTIVLSTVPLPDLDEGETDCIHIALSLGDGNSLILMDERAGRAVANERGIRVAGTAAVIGLAKKRGLIDSAKARFERLHTTDFRISAAVIQAVLRGVGELKS